MTYNMFTGTLNPTQSNPIRTNAMLSLSSVSTGEACHEGRGETEQSLVQRSAYTR